MPLSRYRQVVIFCPVAASGGPEAIHQLSLSLHALGVACHIVHTDDRHGARVVDGKLVMLRPPHPTMTQVYAAYAPQYRDEIPIGPDTLIVLPEGLARAQRSFSGCGVAIWWLSIDNVFRALEGLDAEAELARVLQRPDLFHLHQSAYARDWLRTRGVERLFDLGDYTSPNFTAVPATAPARAPSVSYNGSKGSELAEDFFAANPDFEALALRGFSKPELQAIFRERMLYVDFGHFPGKDRLPREAAVCGGIVFVRRQGAAASYEDFPLPDDFKFSEEDVASGALRARLQAAIADPEGHWARQAQFRSLVAWEKAHFHDQVMRLWGVRRGV